jgi:hypothetical protein
MKKLTTCLLIATAISLPLFILHMRYQSAYMGCEADFEHWEGACSTQRAIAPYAFDILSGYLFFVSFALPQSIYAIPGMGVVIVFALFSLPFWAIASGAAWVWKFTRRS